MTIFFYINLFMAQMQILQCLQTVQNFHKVPTRGQLTSRFYPAALRERARAGVLLSPHLNVPKTAS